MAPEDEFEVGKLTVLVTGASGFLGWSLCQHLTKEGFQVLAGVRDLSGRVPPGSIPFIIGDLEKPIQALDFSQVDAIIHLAGLAHVVTQTNESSGIRYLRVNAEATRELAAAASLHGVTHFIYASSIKALENTPLAETRSVAQRTVWLKDPYGSSKREAEMLLEELATGTDMKISVLRLPLVYGPGAKANFAQLLRFSLLPIPNALSRSKAKRSMISIRNLVECFGYLVSMSRQDLRAKPPYQVFVVRDGRDLSAGEIVDKIRWMSNQPRLNVSIMGAVARAAAKYLLPRRNMGGLFEESRVDDSALRKLGWRPIETVEQGLENTLGLVPRKLRLLFVVTEDWYFHSHRLDLAVAAREAGWDVHVGASKGRHEDAIESAGIVFHPLNMVRTNGNPLLQIRALLQIRQLLRMVKPDVVHYVALKPIAFGGLASLNLPIPSQVFMFAGMGSLFARDSWTARHSQNFLLRFFRNVLSRANSWIVVQNNDDRQLLEGAGVGLARHVRLIPGSGVNVEMFPRTQFPDSSTVTVSMVSRMLWDKGVADFVEAVRLLRTRGLTFQAQLVGSPDTMSKGSIPLDVLNGWQAEGVVDWLGQRDDVYSIWAQSDVAVLPTYYREGVPKVLLEAASVGRPLVACDVPGVRDLIRHGVSGFLVPPRDPTRLANALSVLITDKARRYSMGNEAHNLVTRNFSNQIINASYLDLYQSALGLGNPEDI